MDDVIETQRFLSILEELLQLNLGVLVLEFFFSEDNFFIKDF
jgi:hypothetical protein